MNLGNMFVKEVVSARPQDSLEQVTRLMDEHNVGAVVVVEQDRPVGLVTDRDIALAVCSHGRPKEEHIQNVMTCPISTLKQRDGIYWATQRMMELAVRRLPVVDDTGRLTGLVTLDDLLVLLSRELHNLAEGVRFEATPQ